MTETMGQIIRRLRKEKNLTQEELAEQLNISAPAVSKWENDTSLPDISQVVPLANLFGVTTDVLFGMHGADHEAEVRARLEEIFRMSDNCPDGEEGPTALLILDKYREAMRLYPNNPTIMVNAMAFAEMVIGCNEKELRELIGQGGLDSLTDEIIRWAELVIKYSTSIDDVLSAKKRLMEIHVRRKNWKEAHGLADTFPGELYDIRGIRKADLYYSAGEREKQRQQQCWNIRELADQLGHQAMMQGNLYMNEDKYEDALYCYDFVRDMLDALYREEKYRPPFQYNAYPLYRFPAVCRMKLGQPERALVLLEQGVDFLFAQAKDFNKRQELDIPLLRDCTFGYGYDGDAEYSYLGNRLRNLIGGEEFAELSENPRYLSL
ncbi:MAG: helix-turn-helix transcriptional regulator, partial [Clostridia bacterium]|nr:helix-turn-helix transcriptional regulator [Clostridia bacterium]